MPQTKYSQKNKQSSLIDQITYIPAHSQLRTIICYISSYSLKNHIMGLCITSILIMGENLYKIYIEFTLFI